MEITPNLTSLKNFYVNLDDKKTEFYGNVEISDNEKNRFVNTNIQISEFDFEKYIIGLFLGKGKVAKVFRFENKKSFYIPNLLQTKKNECLKDNSWEKIIIFFQIYLFLVH